MLQCEWPIGSWHSSIMNYIERMVPVCIIAYRFIIKWKLFSFSESMKFTQFCKIQINTPCICWINLTEINNTEFPKRKNYRLFIPVNFVFFVHTLAIKWEISFTKWTGRTRKQNSKLNMNVNIQIVSNEVVSQWNMWMKTVRFVAFCCK